MQPTNFRAFLRAMASSWFTGMSGPLTVPLTIAAVFVPSNIAKAILGVTAVFCFWAAAYGIWYRERMARNTAEGRRKLEGELHSVTIGQYNGKISCIVNAAIRNTGDPSIAE